MSSTDCPSARAYLHPHNSYHHQHTMSANQVPTFSNRRVTSYGSITEDAIIQGSGLASPRYSPNIQPWRRQQTQSSLSFVPPTSPRQEQSEYTTAPQSRRPVERPPVCMSPFRSVRRMKQPFQLRLPSSPSLENIASAAKDARLSRQMSGGQTLRAWRSDQNINVTSLDSFGLLPSPPLSDSLDSQSSPSSTYFSSKYESESDYDPRTPKGCVCIPGKESCDDCGGRKQDDRREISTHEEEATNVHMAHSKLVKQCESAEGQLPQASAHPEPMPSPVPSADSGTFGRRNFSGSSNGSQRSRSGTVSSEGSWVPSSLSYCGDWLQGAPVETADVQGEKSREQSRRKCQIVQKSPPRLRTAPLDKHEICTVARKSKPKLVDISRQSSPAMSYTLPTPPRPIPSTPDLGQQEVSAFSPDTPMEMSDSGYITHRSCSPPDDFSDDKEDDDDYTDAGSLSSESIGETVACNQPTPVPLGAKSPPKPDIPPKFSTSPQVQASPGRSSIMSEKEELEKWWDHEWTIDQLEHSVKDFPRNMLRLTSPVIMFIRHNNERALIRPFRDIFPNVAENLLGGLCAALIARNHVVTLASNNRRINNFSHPSPVSRLDTVPEKVATSPGMQFSPATPSRIKERVLGSRSVELRKELDRIVDNLLFAICGRADETVKSAVVVLAQVLESKN
ncbi:hypothetical protein ASPCADRAFT_139826 [Aspergillus carbonarius ITEM 5010]|uniref:Uncharacterized protein n=1 Tax=Aspergillus carbonarius (strain ITEM 5010) TaxID=602072 RepID=A0A1R3RVS6_ASPC5|nr:hypothetical protein ASPCADRAFT_139826 [Aspergillus carbonarius ITEM 5010]